MFDLFRSFLPLRNPIGFGAADFVEFTLTVLILACVLIWNPWIRHRIARFSTRTAWCMATFAALPIVLRLLLLPHHPVPSPEIYDEFSHLLVADTLLHFRLANPPHPLHQFFETFFVLQQPTYSSIYPLGQGLILALGRIVSGNPWTGVVLCTGALCAFSYWMLRAWVSPLWAFLGGLLAVIEFGPLSSWMNSYWGGALAATAGCLIFGSLPRLIAYARKRDAIALGVGFAIHLLTRQFESVLLFAGVLLFFVVVPRPFRDLLKLKRPLALALASALPAIVLILLQNHAVTHSWTTLPEQLSRYQYGVPTTLTIEPLPVPHNTLTPEQALDYRAQSLMHTAAPDSLSRFMSRLEFRVRYYRFFFLPALYPALIAFLFALRERRFLWVVATLAIFALGTNLFPYLLVHYLAAVTCLFLLVSVVGLEQLSRLTIGNGHVGAQAARLIVFFCAAHFAFWYGLHLFETGDPTTSVMQYETWDAINHAPSPRRLEVARQIAALPGKQLVFVRYWPQHIYQEEWVWNAADIDRSRTVFARDLGAQENEKLLQYYPNRNAWLLEPDFRPPRLTPYH